MKKIMAGIGLIGLILVVSKVGAWGFHDHIETCPVENCTQTGTHYHVDDYEYDHFYHHDIPTDKSEDTSTDRNNHHVGHHQNRGRYCH